MSSINCKIQRKLSVFISSRMSGRYDFIRRELAFLLINTDLFDVFIYEDSGAGSENNIDSYIEELKRSDAVIFMVDNKDDVSDAVLNEERTAKENGLRRIYIFCNQDSKEHTQMQESLKDKYGAKYEETPSFREMPERAYLSILQDIISIYRRKTPPHSSGDDIPPRLPDTPSSPEPVKYPSAPKCLADYLAGFQVQDIDMKICACEILTLLGEDAVKSIPDNREAYCSGHPDMLKKSLPVMLEYVYVLMMSLCRSNTSEATELLFMNPDYEASTIMKLLSISLNFLRSKHSDSIADVIMAFVLSSTVRNEKDIHFLAVLCLLELTKNMKYRHTALKKLAAYMDCGQAEIRVNIVSGVAYIKDKQTEYIMQKAYTDNNYLVRRSALAEKGDK